MPSQLSGEPPGVGRGRFAAIVWVALAALLLRAIYLWNYASSLPFLDQPVLDAAYYDAWARTILSGQLFTDGPFYQAPGYPWFLAAIYRILGPEPRNAILVQALIGVGTTLATMGIAGRLFGRMESLLAGILMLLAGPIYFFESKLLVETWALFLLTVSVYLTLVADRDVPVPMTASEKSALDRLAAEGRKPPEPAGKAKLAALVAGLMAGACAVTRANLIFVPAFFVLLGVTRAAGRRRPWATTLLYAAGVLLALLPTTVHNLQQGVFTPVATSGGLNFYIGNYRGARGIYEDPPSMSGVIARQEIEADSLVKADLGEPLPPGPESGYWLSRGVREITSDLPAWLQLVGRKLWLLVNRQEEENNGSLGLEASRVVWLRIAALPFNFFVAAGLVGLALAAGLFGTRRGARADLTGPILVLLTVLVTGVLFFVMARLRLAALPFLAVFTAHGLARLDGAWRSGHRKAIAVIGAVGLLFVALSWRSPLGPARSPEWESQLFLETGRGLEARNRKAKAVTAYTEAVTINPKNVNAYIHLGQMKLEDRDLAGAVSDFEKARDAAPDNFSVRNNLGILYYHAQRHQDADREMVQAIRLKPDQAGPFFYRGLVAKEMEDMEGAELLYKEALQRDATFTGAYVRLIEALLAQEKLAEARGWADKAGEKAVALPPGLAARLR